MCLAPFTANNEIAKESKEGGPKGPYGWGVSGK